MADKAEAAYHPYNPGCPWCGSRHYFIDSAKYMCPECNRCGVLPTPVYPDRPRWRKVYLRSLLTTVLISLWFFMWLHFFGDWGYLAAVPSTAAWFAREEMTW